MRLNQVELLHQLLLQRCEVLSQRMEWAYLHMTLMVGQRDCYVLLLRGRGRWFSEPQHFGRG